MSTLEGKLAVVTGANTGIGRVTATELAALGAHVVLASRSAEKTEPVVEDIKRETGNPNIDFQPLDLADLASVRAAGEAIAGRDLPISLLINNAGLAGTRGQTKDGFEIAFGVNHLGHFLFTQLLLERIKAAGEARIVIVASKAHYQAKALDFTALQQLTPSRTGLQEYAVSKLCNVLHAKALAERLEGTGVTTYALHPGVVASDVWRKVPFPFRGLIKLFMITNEEGAKTSLHCATAPERANETGRYYDECQERQPSKLALDAALREELWTRSVEWTHG